MTRPTRIFTLLLALALTACGSEASRDLEDAAEQSDPAAAAVLRNEAGSAEDAGDVQQALQNAGNAAAAPDAPSKPVTGQQAKPHAAGDPVPPPKTDGPAQ